ncbi:hypothetical protein HAX54_032002 [Datura stramonium]|uniref:Secreted protein n=1 Tax=Datura stramonium TaxID=4076 RepID=A0ABS8VCJ8_DATST|nr:hypothetical protein [Datura stramonium]
MRLWHWSIVYAVVESWCGVICVDVIHDKISVTRAHQTKAQTRAQVNPQPEVVNGSQPRVAASDRVQEQVVQDAPSIVPAVVPNVALPTDVVMRLLNVLEVLVPNHGGLLVPQTTSQAQTQVQVNVAATKKPQLTP